MRDIDTDAAAAHEMFLSFEGMEGVPVTVASLPKKLTLQGYLQRIYPGDAPGTDCAAGVRTAQ